MVGEREKLLNSLAAQMRKKDLEVRWDVVDIVDVAISCSCYRD